MRLLLLELMCFGAILKTMKNDKYKKIVSEKFYNKHTKIYYKTKTLYIRFISPNKLSYENKIYLFIKL